MLIYLASEIKHGFDYLMQIAPPKVENSELSLSQGDSAAFQKSLKIHSYQLRVLISLLDSFVDTVSSCIAPIYNVMVNILMRLPPTLLDLSISSSGVSDLQQQLVNGFEPLMCLLVRNRTFGQYMLRKTEDCRPEENLAVLQIHVKILDCLPKQEEDIYDSWMKVQDSVSSTEYSILQRVCRHLEECHIELCSSLTVPGSRLMSVYEFAVTHVCGFVGSLPAKYFDTLEECLLENLLSAYPVVSRVAEDIWCFMSRFGSADLCYHHTVLLLDLTSSPQDTLIPAVVRLVQRLVKFLAPNHKTKLLQRYPVDKYRTLWGEVLLPVLGGELSAHQYQGMVLACAQPVQMFVAATSNTYADLIQLLSDLKCLTKLVSVNHKNDVPSIAMETVSNLWLSWAADWSGETIFTQCLVEMTELAGLMIGHIKNLVVLQILESLHAARGQGGVCIEVAACRFLQRCKKKAFTPDVQVFRRLSSLFHSLLTSQDPLVQFTALVAFTQFAESTPHEDLVPECLADNQQLQDLVVAFLNKNLPLPEDYKETVFLSDQLVRLRKPLADQTSTGQGTAPQGNISDVAMAKEEKPCQRDMLDDISESNQRATKRKRPDDAAMPQAELTTLEQLISDLDAATRKLESMELSDENIVNKTSRRTKLLDIHSRLQRCLNKMA
ncbi:hypothetical protein DPMN_068210 [Dreissena polymorpha]|uniref:Uncharacterized protein n=2 Tax=Dreissena polymorpha TaxID=45954 RepID=A0A9D4BM03_DREPO|nr:hypothetical protein DPMN_068210 [Dreissena polymorpha]